MSSSRRRDTPLNASDAGSTDLELEDDPTFHERERTLRRAGTIFLCVFLAAAMLGLFGTGPLSRASARSVDGTLRVHYERFARQRARSSAVFTVLTAAQPGAIRLTLDSAFARSIIIERVLPQPVSEQGAAGGYVFEFSRAATDTLTGIVLQYRPEALGSLPVRAAVGGGEVRFRQFVYP